MPCLLVSIILRETTLKSDTRYDIIKLINLYKDMRQWSHAQAMKLFCILILFMYSFIRII